MFTDDAERRAYSGSEFWFMPACSAFGAEWTLGRNRIEDERNTIARAKLLFKVLQTNGAGFAGSAGSFGGNPYVNAIASVSFLDDRAVTHGNLGAIHNRESGAVRGTWALGIEHIGPRYALKPKRLQVDATLGAQGAVPARRFHSIGIRISF